MNTATGGDPPSVGAPLRILLVEDTEDDAVLIVRELRREGLVFTSQRVQSEAALRQALHHFVPDLVLTDHSLPRFNAHDALRVVHGESPRTPVIVVTGSLDEETAAEYIKAGAADYIVKHRLFRLGGAVKQALAHRRALDEAARAEAARTRSEQRFRKLVEHSSDVITLLDGAGRILYSTQALKPTLGYQQDELSGHVVFDIVHPEDRPQAQALFRNVLATVGAAMRGALRVRHQDGSWRDLEIVAANHLDDPVVEAIVVNYRDVTDRKRAETALRDLEEQHRQAQKMEAIGRLASGVAHDFNNVLSVIGAYCEFVMDALGPKAPAREDVLEIRRAAKRGSALTQQLLSFSRQQAVAAQRVDLTELVKDLTGMLQRLLGSGVAVTFTPAPGVAPVWADPGQLEQVVMNLAVNARDAMPEGGRLALEVAGAEVDPAVATAHGVSPGSYVTLIVSDTGAGMDTETKARLFEPFFTTKAQGKGTGLGLATVYGIVQRAGGFMQVESEVGKGSAFRIFLPRQEDIAALR